MWVRAIEPDASINSMMFGFTSAAVVEASGVAAISVWPPWLIEASVIASTAATPRAPRRRRAEKGWTIFMGVLVISAAIAVTEPELG